MRTTSTLVGLVLFTLTATAHAEETAPAAAAPPASEAAAAPADQSAPPAGDASAALTPVDEQTSVSRRRWQAGLSFLPMALGRFTSTVSTTETNDAAFAYGFGLAAGYEILRGLSVGLAPQLILNVKDKTSSSTAKQFDLMARVAYAYPVVETISIYAEVLPGYSLIIPPAGGFPRGFVVAFGGGCAMNLTDRVFVNLGVDYQMGFQTRYDSGVGFETRTKYLRASLGGGVKF
jgi:hypothetical protein